MKLEFNNPDKRDKKEIKQKFLKPDSELYLYIWNLKHILDENKYDHEDLMDLNVEILNDDKESTNVFLERVKKLEGLEIDENYSKNYRIIGNTITFIIGRIEGYNKLLKIIIGIFDYYSQYNALEIILSNISNLHNNSNPIHQDLQSQLHLIIKKMKENNCPLPDDLELVYNVMHHRDRQGQCVRIRAFLTKENAIDFSGDDEEWEGKYGSYEKHLIVDTESSNKVWLENRPHLSGCKHELLCELIES